MSLSLFARKAVVCGSLAGLCTTLLTAQPAYLPLGNELPIAGILPGDQSHPRASVNANGGFVVWDDNATDGSGLGIKAVGLDTFLQAAQKPFRVNFKGAGDQEEPQVALLNGGGAVFAWKGGRFGFQQVYARFLSSSNTWLTEDVLVSAPGSVVRSGPALAVLKNGNVAVVWSTVDQRGVRSMQDVYAQVLGPDGVKVGPLVAVNQRMDFNQRTPAVAALSDGSFVVVWVSEQQRRLVNPTTEAFMFAGSQAQPSVDIYARLLDETAQPRGNEFLVNADALICANPAVAADLNGGFVVAWSQGDPQNLVNPWDVMARAYSPAAGSVIRVNSRERGSQFGPGIAVLGQDMLVVWTSVGQDGSRDGVFGRFFGQGFQPMGDEFQVNSTTRLDQNQPAVVADAFGRFMTLWRTTQIQERVSVEVCSRLYALPGFEPLALATNYAGPVFVGPTNTTDSGGGPVIAGNEPILPFPVVPGTDGQVSNPFERAAGSYQGLVYNSTNVTAGTSGYVTASTTSTKRYSVQIRLGTRTYAFSGVFDESGNAEKQISRGRNRTPVFVRLHMDLFGSDQLVGSIEEDANFMEFLAERLVFNRVSNPCDLAGRYTVLISPPELQPACPEGSGYGTLTISTAGRVAFAGKLADGTTLTQSSAVSKNGMWPFYGAPYSRRGVVLSWVQLSTNDVGGDLLWIKPASKTKYYPNGFAVMCRVTGSPYVRPATGSRVLDLSDGRCEFVFTGADLAGGLRNMASIDARHRFADPESNGIRATVNPATGVFQGSFTRPGTRTRITFRGVLLQNQNLGAGYFQYNNASGQVGLSSPTP